MMDNEINQLFRDTMAELSEKCISGPENNTYELILNQLEFVYDCLIHDKDIFQELNGRELTFPAVASKNLSGPDEGLLKKIGDISVYLSHL